MAVYHFEAQVISRCTDGRRRSAVAVAAYRAAERLRDKLQGETFDYRAKRGVTHQEILLPEGAAPWLANRETLWNHVEKLEKRRDAQLAREFNISLPHELTPGERLALIRGFVREEFVAHGMVADLTLHDPMPDESDQRHFHAHVMLALRQAHGKGLARVKTRGWNSRALLARWREQWQMHANRALELAGHAVRIDHRTLLDQRQDALKRGDERAAMSLNRLPQIAVGPKAIGRHRRGVPFVAKRWPGQKSRKGKAPPKDEKRESRVEKNKRILRANAAKAQGWAFHYRFRRASLDQRIVRWQRKTREMSGDAKEKAEKFEARTRAFGHLSLTRCLHNIGLATKAQVKAAQLEAWATLEESKRLELERRFAERIKQYREQQRRIRVARGARRRRARYPTVHGSTAP